MSTNKETRDIAVACLDRHITRCREELTRCEEKILRLGPAMDTLREQVRALEDARGEIFDQCDLE